MPHKENIMDYISPQDFYEIRLASLLSNIDKEVILELYQPLIGATASALFLSLAKQKRNEDGDEVYAMSSLLDNMHFNPATMLSARHALEAVGLLKTYEKQGGELRYYIYILYAPKTPKEFFDDVLFKGLLIQYVGEKQALKLAHQYRVDLSIPNEYREISCSFVDVFNPDYNDKSFAKDFGDMIVGHNVGRLKTEFSYDLFFEHIETNSQIVRSAFSTRDMKEIERIATLFGLDERELAYIIIEEFPYDKKTKIDFVEVANKAKERIKYPFLQHKAKTRLSSSVSGESMLASKIKLMEEMAPARFMSLLQNNTKPAPTDLATVEMLSNDYHINNGVINVIIEYTLKKCANKLSRNYALSVASTLLREGVDTVVDAMNCLNKSSKRTKKETVIEHSGYVHAKEETSSTKQTEVTNPISDEEMDDILSIFDDAKKG